MSELEETRRAVQKRYGEATIKKGRNVVRPDRISTGIFTLDFALLGGMPMNRLSMVVGERHAGKSMISNLLIANAQRMYPDKVVVLLDIEGTFESTWAERLGVDLDALEIVECDSGEMAVDVGDAMIGTEDASLVVADSIAAITPMKEQEASAEDAFVGLQARLVGNFVRRMASSLVRERNRGHVVSVLFLNQFRSKIGGFAGFGEPRSIPGGKALEFATTIQMIIKNKENKGKDAKGIDTITHNEHAFTITKNKLNGGPRTGEFIMTRSDDDATGLLAGMVDDSATLLSFAKKFGMYTGGGSAWKLEFEGYNLKFGKAAQAIQALREDSDFYWDLRTEVIRAQAVSLGMTKEFIARI